jgi:hypothetical protein
MRAIPEQRREHMDRALQFLHSEVAPSDVLFTDQPTSFQLQHYLCHDHPGQIANSAGFESYTCDGRRIISTDLAIGSLTQQNFDDKFRAMQASYPLSPNTEIWVVQAAWSRGLGEALQSRSEFHSIRPQSFDYYIEIFKLCSNPVSPPER